MLFGTLPISHKHIERINVIRYITNLTQIVYLFMLYSEYVSCLLSMLLDVLENIHVIYPRTSLGQ